MEEIDNVKLMCDDMMSSLMEEVASTSDLNIICADGKYCCNKYLFGALFPKIGSLQEYYDHQDDILSISMPDLSWLELDSLVSGIINRKSSIKPSKSLVKLFSFFSSFVIPTIDIKKSEVEEVIIIGFASENVERKDDLDKDYDPEEDSDTDSEFEPPVVKERKVKSPKVISDGMKYSRKRLNARYLSLDCQVCDKSFANKSDPPRALYLHLKHKHGPQQEKVQCSSCKVRYYKGDEENHKMKCSKSCTKRTYLCNTCGKFFKTANALTSHHKIVHEEDIQTCDLCGAKLNSKSSLNTHKKLKHQEAPIPCEICGNILANSFSLRSHMKRHNMKKQACKICGKLISPVVGKMERHMFSQHPGEIDVNVAKFKCKDCDKRFLDTRQLAKHAMSVHLKLRPYKCRYGCAFAYNDDSNRGSHERKTHGGIFKDTDYKEPNIVTIVKEHGYL